MKILKIRLRNVKSYADDAPEIGFAGGVNFLSGFNGSGKTTLIEAVGFAMFDVLPYSRPDFVRRGAKTGVVTVWIEDKDEVFEIERKVGSTNSWVVYDSGRVSLHEKSDDVLRFLCERFRVPDADQLREVFQSILGVRQGMFTSLFTMTGAKRKEIFDRIINVHLYRERSDERAGVKNQMVKKEIGELNTRIAAGESYVKDHQEDPKKLAEAEAGLKIAEGQVAGFSAIKADLQKKKETFEGLRKQVEAADRDLAGLVTAIAEGVKAAAKAREEADRSRAAAQACARTEKGHQAFREAEKALTAIEEKRTARDALVAKIGALAEQIKGDEAAIDQIRSNLASRRAEETKEAGREGDLNKAWKEAEGEAKAAEKAAGDAKEALDKKAGELDDADEGEKDLRGRLDKAGAAAEQVRDLGAEAVRLEKALAGIKEVEALAAGAAAARRAERALKTHDDKIESSIEEQEKNKKQLASMTCPFIKERCDRVAPAVFKEKIIGLQDELHGVKRELMEAGKKADEAESAGKDLAGLLEKKARLTEAGRESRRERAKARKLLTEWKPVWGEYPSFPAGDDGALDLAAFERYAAGLRDEMKRRRGALREEAKAEKLAGQAAVAKRRGAEAAREKLDDTKKRLAGSRTETARIQAGMEKRAKGLDDARQSREALDGKLKGYATLDADIAGVRGARESARPAHEEYVRNEKAAGELETREGDVKRKEEELARTGVRKTAVEADRARLAAGYDATEAAKVDKDFEAATGKLSAAETEQRNLSQKRGELSDSVARLRKQEVEVARWTTERSRLKRFEVVLEDVWGILRALGPRVSERLMGMISGRANRIFGLLHGQPGRLAWGKDYEVRLLQGGAEYPFANLSGGEQMSAALAIQMSMARYFVGSSFCIFDEPTIHLDETRRARLTSALRDAQQEASFTQVFVVSHDDTFGPYVDHQIRLRKDAVAGTVAQA